MEKRLRTTDLESQPVFHKVGGIAPLGAILMGKGAKKQRG